MSCGHAKRVGQPCPYCPYPTDEQVEEDAQFFAAEATFLSHTPHWLHADGTWRFDLVGIEESPAWSRHHDACGEAFMDRVHTRMYEIYREKYLPTTAHRCPGKTRRGNRCDFDAGHTGDCLRDPHGSPAWRQAEPRAEQKAECSCTARELLRVGHNATCGAR